MFSRRTSAYSRYAIKKTTVAQIETVFGNTNQEKRTFSPARIKPTKNMRPLNLITIFCSSCFSFAFRRFSKSLGFTNIITMPATNIGTNNAPINSQPCQYANVPAGKKMRRPIKTTPSINFTIACTNNFPVICFSSSDYILY